MGFVTLGIFVFNEQGVDGAILQMVNHGLITGGLFLLVGVIYERTHDRTIAKMGGLAGRLPIYATTLGFFAFASAGLPGLSGFVGEFLSLVGAFLYNPAAAAIATFCMILAAAYLLWMFQRLAFGPLSGFLAGLGHHLTDMTAIEILTLAPLAALIVVFGIFPGLLLDLVKTPARSFLAGAATGQPIDLGLPAVVIGIVLPIGYALIRTIWAALADLRAPGAPGASEPAAGAAS
jgi:NADH-quinone oxidoreductase subunit M